MNLTNAAKELTTTRCLFTLRRYLSRPEKIMGLVLLGLLVFFVVLPLLQILIGATTFSPGDTRLAPDAVPGQVTFFHWKRVAASALSLVLLYKPLLNSVSIAVGVILVALPLGSLLAWLVVRTDLPFKRVIGNLLIIPYIMPSWVMALAWFTAFKNERIGGAMGFLQALGVRTPDWLSYGYIPIVLALTLHYFPYAFILVSGALATLDSQLEDTASVLGASRLKILRKITFPLMLPAIGSAFVLIFSKAIGTFATPAILGLPVRYFTLSTRIYDMLGSKVEGSADVLLIFLILISGFTIYVNNKVLGVRKKFTTISGKGSKIRRTRLRQAKLPLTIIVFIFVGACILFPLAFLILQSITLYGDFNLKELTLQYWIGKADPKTVEGAAAGILRDSFVLGGAWNSIKLSLLAAAIVSFIGLFFGYAVAKARGSVLSRTLENLAFTPYIIPDIAFGGIYLSMFSRSWGPLPSLYGTFVLLVLVTVAKRLPYTSRTGISAMMQIDQSLEEAAYLRGISWLGRMGRIIIPLGKSGLMAGFVLSFITSMRMLSLIILIVTPNTRLLTSITFRYVGQGFLQHANAIAALIIIITVAGYFLAGLFGKSKLEHIGGD
ncbi:MAG: iron ABC transporter permease [Spirochaetota bacterium]